MPYGDLRRGRQATLKLSAFPQQPESRRTTHPTFQDLFTRSGPLRRQETFLAGHPTTNNIFTQNGSTSVAIIAEVNKGQCSSYLNPIVKLVIHASFVQVPKTISSSAPDRGRFKLSQRRVTVDSSFGGIRSTLPPPLTIHRLTAWYQPLLCWY